MTLILSGTDGLSDVDGSAATPAIRGTDANTGIFFPAADTIAFSEGGVESMRIDSSGNVGIGTAVAGAISPSLRLGNSGSGGGVVTATLSLGSYSTGYGSNIISSSDFNSSSASYLAFGTTATGASGLSAPVERMRIDSSGNVGIGTSPNTTLTVKTASSVGTQIYKTSDNSSNIIGIYDSQAAGNTTYTLLGTDTTGATVGFASGGNFLSVGRNGTGTIRDLIIHNYDAANIKFATSNAERARIDSSGNLLVGTTTAVRKLTLESALTPIALRNSQSAAGKRWDVGPEGSNSVFTVYNQGGSGVYIVDGGTSWTANSDERVKDIIEPITDATEKVSTLRAVIGKYKTDEEGTRRSFLIAQDVQAVLPEAVSVKEDEIGTLGVQYTEVIPLLVAAIKEQNQLITTLTDRITALETPTGTQA